MDAYVGSANTDHASLSARGHGGAQTVTPPSASDVSRLTVPRHRLEYGRWNMAASSQRPTIRACLCSSGHQRFAKLCFRSFDYHSASAASEDESAAWDPQLPGINQWVESLCDRSGATICRIAGFRHCVQPLNECALSYLVSNRFAKRIQFAKLHLTKRRLVYALALSSACHLNILCSYVGSFLPRPGGPGKGVSGGTPADKYMTEGRVINSKNS